MVNASSQKGMLAINGMSYHDRASGFANSGIIVSVGPEDYEDRGVLSGMYFQEELERKTFELCGGKIPVCYLEDFLLKREGKVDRCFDNAIKGSYSGADVYGLLPEFVSSTIAEGMNAFGRKIKGFDRGDTLILASETRTSSPVRIVRGEDYQSLSIKGLYPCGEGAGYAGGITSACVDGIKVALAICGPDMIK